eukprot:7386823-Prymnesium_polylepis.1
MVGSCPRTTTASLGHRGARDVRSLNHHAAGGANPDRWAPTRPCGLYRLHGAKRGAVWGV